MRELFPESACVLCKELAYKVEEARGYKAKTAKSFILKIEPTAKAVTWKKKFHIVRDKRETDRTRLFSVPITGLYDTEEEAWLEAAKKVKVET